ncbi:receptor-like protein EIX2 [Lactuca sativa]|uniref:receptor-like protein EIX2 n=1 Tax=Lactuca sativa TaxID=4236 RepID=UPI000CD96927|nr:receptor-like protein EIX2 [Lactuca sativa]
MYLDLSYNSIYGIIPPVFGNLTNLKVLFLEYVGRCGVENLEWLSHLSHLEELRMDGISLAKQNHWVDVMLSLRKLSYLSLDGCELSQVMYPYSSSFLNSSSSIHNLSLANNNLTSSIISDTIPLEFWDAWPSRLRYLNLSSNNIKGEASDLSSNFAINSVIDLSSNKFYGTIQNVSSAVALLNLSKNKFSGGIYFLCQMVDGFLEFLDLSHNFLTGQLPDCLWHFKYLKVLNLGHNNLSGRIPSSIGSLMELEALYLYENNLYGELPLSLKNCMSLTSLNLGANRFSGNVPVWIGENLWGLYVLILRSNNFFGTIPLQVCQLPNLQILDFSRNNLHGSIPSWLNNLTSMVQQGMLPTQNVHSLSTSWYSSGVMYELLDGEYVDHAMIEWQGDEHEFTRNLGLLKTIDLSSNNLTCEIPYEITGLYELITLNLSKNGLLGEIPLKIDCQGESHLTLNSNPLNLQDTKENLDYVDFPFPENVQEMKKSQVPLVFGKNVGDGEDIDELDRWFYIGGATGFATGFWIACGILLVHRHGRHAFFQFYDRIKDWVYVKVMVFVVNLPDIKCR